MVKMDDQVNKESRVNKESLDHLDHLGSGDSQALKATEERPDSQDQRVKMESQAHQVVKANLGKRVLRVPPDLRACWDHEESRANQVNRGPPESQVSLETLG